MGLPVSHCRLTIVRRFCLLGPTESIFGNVEAEIEGFLSDTDSVMRVHGITDLNPRKFSINY